MNTKEWAIVIVVMIVIAIAASLITSNLTGNVVGVRSGNNYKVYTATEIDNLFAADTYSNLSKNIKANSCDADGICEIAKTISTKAGSTSALVLTSDTKEVIVQDSLSTGSVLIKGKSISTSPGSTSALTLTSDIKKVIVDGSLSSTNLVGTGNAYACIDSNGKIYRSLTACK